jgi:hypothetical protein
MKNTEKMNSDFFKFKGYLKIQLKKWGFLLAKGWGFLLAGHIDTRGLRSSV